MTQDALCYSCLEASQALQLSTHDVCLNTLALFHVHGLITSFILPLLAGGKVAFYGRFQPDYFLDWLVDSQATWYSVGPTIHLAILKEISTHPVKAKNHALRFMRSGSAPSNPQVIAALEQHFGVPLIQGYGMSEIPLFTSTILPSNLSKERSQGYAKISKESELAIANESGEIVPHGTVGEIIARGRNVMKSYLDNPVANRVAFREGWFRTGDLGWLDECGYLHLAGRLKETIVRGGNKVWPQEVDDVLMQFSEVEEVATFAVEHPRLGEDVVAAVVPKSGVNITEQTLRTLLLERIADFKIPSQILFVDNIPKGKTGKIQRNKLAEEFAERLKSTYASPRNELEVKIASLFAQILNLDKIGIHDNFFSLGGDSLTGTQIISRICEIFAINIPLVTLFHHQTVAELATVVEKATDCQTKQFHPWQSLIQIKQGRATKDPMFLIHDVAGSVLFYRQLANHLRSDRAIYVIQARGLDGREAPTADLSEMAANYIDEIRQVQPMGPYYIGGYSFGGVVNCQTT
jgi:oxalate---CoA ligase